MLGREAAWLIVPVIAEEGEHRETVPLENPQQQNVPWVAAHTSEC